MSLFFIITVVQRWQTVPPCIQTGAATQLFRLYSLLFLFSVFLIKVANFDLLCHPFVNMFSHALFS